MTRYGVLLLIINNDLAHALSDVKKSSLLIWCY